MLGEFGFGCAGCVPDILVFDRGGGSSELCIGYVLEVNFSLGSFLFFGQFVFCLNMKLQFLLAVELLAALFADKNSFVARRGFA